MATVIDYSDVSIELTYNIISEKNDVSFISTKDTLTCFSIINKKKQLFYHENEDEGLQKIIKRNE